MILLTNARTFLRAIGVDPGTNHFVYAAILAIWAVALYFAFSFARRIRGRCSAANYSELPPARTLRG